MPNESGTPEYPNKPTTDGKFKSEYSMGMFDFERFHKILTIIDGLVFRVGRGEYTYMKDLFSMMRTLYANWKPIIYGSERAKKLDRMFKYLEPEIVKSEIILSKNRNAIHTEAVSSKIVAETGRKLLILHRKLMVLKQYIGLGIRVKKGLSQRKMIKLGVHGVGSESKQPNESGKSDKLS